MTTETKPSELLNDWLNAHDSCKRLQRELEEAAERAEIAREAVWSCPPLTRALTTTGVQLGGSRLVFAAEEQQALFVEERAEPLFLFELDRILEEGATDE